MIIGIENIINWIETNKTPYWYVKDFGGANIIFASGTEDDSTSLEDSKNKLRGCLQTLANGNYSIESWHTVGQKKNWGKVKFQITNSDQTSNHVGIGNIHNLQPNIPQKSLEQLIEDALQKERTINKIDRLEADIKLKDARIKELETDLNSIGTRVSKRVEQVFGPMLDMQEIQKSNNASLGSLDEESEEIAQLLERWSNVDSEFKDTLKNIVKLAETDSIKYNMGKQFLKNG
jgi:chaperonin cofactor prefoldin